MRRRNPSSSQYKERVERQQVEKLRRYLKSTVLPFSAYYSRLFAEHRIDPMQIRSLDDLAQVPFTSKRDLIATADEPDKIKQFVLIPDQAKLSRRPSTIARALLTGRKAVRARFEREFRPLMMTSTTGRSSDPVPFLYTQHDLDNLALTGGRVMRICGAERDMRMINMFPFAPHLAFWQTHYAGTEFGVFVVSTGGGKVMGTDGNLRLIKKIKPQVLIGMPTFIYHVLQQAIKEGVECTGLKKLVLGGEKVPLGMRRKLKKLTAELGASPVQVLTTYGFTEAKMAWPECPAPEGCESSYHLYADLGIVEIVDPITGERQDEGCPGEIVFTPLDSRGCVVIRYRTGDLIDGGLMYEPCPHCGRQVPRLAGKISRSSEVKEMRLDKIKGTLVDFNQLEHILDNHERVGTWQLELRKINDDPLELDELILHVEKIDGSEEAQLSEELQRRFVEETEIHLNKIVFHTEQELRRMQGVGVKIKEERILDNRPKNVGTERAGESRLTTATH
jgi:phenylacetate-CoA ligase